jgi:hypothetical protein
MVIPFSFSLLYLSTISPSIPKGYSLSFSGRGLFFRRLFRRFVLSFLYVIFGCLRSRTIVSLCFAAGKAENHKQSRKQQAS